MARWHSRACLFKGLIEYDKVNVKLEGNVNQDQYFSPFFQVACISKKTFQIELLFQSLPHLAPFPLDSAAKILQLGLRYANITSMQVLRYCFQEGAEPLWPNPRPVPKGTDIPHCSQCGGTRRFEFQVSLIFYLPL